MHGDETQPIATELAYSPSTLVAEAAVNAAVSAKPGPIPQQVDSGSPLKPADQEALDAFVQHLIDGDRESLPLLPEN
jgi:hypothetical protein